MVNHEKYPNILQFENLSSFDSLLHFSTTTSGGVSKGNYKSFNLGVYSGDDLQNVTQNRQRLADMLHLSVEKLLFPYQNHGDSICLVDREFITKKADEQLLLLNGVDALITDQPGVCVGVGTADCVPILIFDPRNKVLAAVHSGWRGTLARLVSKVVETMKDKFGSNPSVLQVGIGPSISADIYEVGDEIVEQFVDAGFLIDDMGYYSFDTNKFHIDLWHINELLLYQAGIPLANIETSQLCTYSLSDTFFSARRQGIESGRMITGGVLID